MKKLKEWLKDEKRLKILTLIGIVGIIMIALSGLIKPKSEIKSSPKESDECEVIAEYTRRYEERVKEIVDSIEGAGESKVMITLESGVEYIYAKEEKQKNDITDRNGDVVDEKNSSEKTTILIEDENGRKKALVKTVKEPSVKGVVVVCEGGDDIEVKLRVTEAVKTALGVGSNSVCVTKLKNNI